ncbi:MAG: hypothetical protein AAF513_07950 [Pseudomonadota bacterium]
MAVLWLLGALPSFAADFRDADWGMTMNEVVALHAGELPADRGIGYLAYDARLANLEVKVFYRFDPDRGLFQAGYDVATDADRGPQALADYRALNALLQQRYPQAQPPQQTWRNRLYAQDEAQWARAVRVGHLKIDWQHGLPRTQVRHFLHGDRRTYIHQLEYTAEFEGAASSVLDQL